MKRPYAEQHPFLSGETVTPGDFACTECGYHHRVPKPKVTNLPVCPRCQNDTWSAGKRK
jgi:uncharacterized paraquat-inducible protein A